MVVDGSKFLRRARVFVQELQAGRYPNAASLAKLCECHENTAQRTIYRLRDEYLVPLDYDSSRRGYYLKDPNYSFSESLPPGKDELTALLLAQDLVGTIEAEDLERGIQALWARYVTANPIVSRDLEPMRRVFSCDSTTVSDLADCGVLQYVSDAAVGQDVRIAYESPWSGAGEKIFEGRILRVHFSDGALYLLVLDKKPKKAILNAAFIKRYERLPHGVQIGNGKEKIDEIGGAENWLDGFGVWSGGEMEQVEIRILAPASRYYAAQRWHGEQQDAWEGDTLVRRMRTAISPELARRVLSLGRYFGGTNSDELRQILRGHALALTAAAS